MPEEIAINDRCTVPELVDLRLQGESFDTLAVRFGCSKMQIYVYYRDAKERGYDGYEPIKLSSLKRMMSEGTLTLPEIAKKLGVSYKGLRFYIKDRGIERTPTKAKVRHLRERRKSLAWIARFYGLSYGTFKSWCRQNVPELFSREELEDEAV